MRKKEVLLLLVILFLAFFVRFSLLDAPFGIFEEDMHLILLENPPETTVFNHYFKLASLYYLFFSPVSFIGLTGLRLISIFLSLVNIFLVFLVIKEVSNSFKLALIGSSFFAFLPVNILVSSMVHPDNLGFMFSFLCILFMVLALKHDSFGFLVLADFSMFLAFLTKPTSFFLMFPFLILVSRQIYRLKEFKYLYALIPFAYVLFIGFLVVTTAFLPLKVFSIGFLSWLPTLLGRLALNFFVPVAEPSLLNYLMVALILWIFLGLIYRLNKMRLNFLELFLGSIVILDFSFLFFLNFYDVWTAPRHLLYSAPALSYFIVKGVLK